MAFEVDALRVQNDRRMAREFGCLGRNAFGPGGTFPTTAIPWLPLVFLVFPEFRLCGFAALGSSAAQILLLLPYAERGEDPIQDIVRGGRSGDRGDRAKGRVEIEQQHLVWNGSGQRFAGLTQIR